jgi:hypothetical protein
VHKGPLLTAIERRGIEARVARRLDQERAEDVQARLARAAELGRLERERTEVEKSILVLSTDIAAARRDRDRDAALNRDGEGRNAPSVERTTSAEQWRDEVRRQREDAKEKSQDRERNRGRTKDKDRDGPDYER